MACGVSCVVTDVGDSMEIVGETGRVVIAEDMHGVAHNIIEILQLPDEERRALGAKARERIRARFDIESVVRQYERFYESLVVRERICAD